MLKALFIGSVFQLEGVEIILLAKDVQMFELITTLLPRSVEG